MTTYTSKVKTWGYVRIERVLHSHYGDGCLVDKFTWQTCNQSYGPGWYYRRPTDTGDENDITTWRYLGETITEALIVADHPR